MNEYARQQHYGTSKEVAKQQVSVSLFSKSRTIDWHYRYSRALLFANISLAGGVIIGVLLMFAGIIVPLGPRVSDYPIRGIDVSHHQGAIDWTSVASGGIRFAYIKASEGGDFRDPRFNENWMGAKEAGVVRGGYHVFTNCRSGLDQARNFLQVLPKERGSLPPAIDISSAKGCSEGFGNAEITAEFNAFVKQIRLYYGHQLIFYSSRSVRNDAVSETKGQLWLRGLLIHPRASYGNNWLFWQYRINGVAPGILGDVDMNVFNGGEQEFRNLFDR